MRAAVFVLGLAFGLVLSSGFAASSAAAGDTPAPTSTTTTATSSLPSSDGGIIPKPNSGVAPESSGDRGGAAQIVLFVAIIGGLVLIVLLPIRSARKTRRPSP